MNRMLIDSGLDQIRVALVQGEAVMNDFNKKGISVGKLYDFDLESSDRKQKKGSIYSGIISHLEPSLDAAFVNYGAERNGFLPFKEIVLTPEQQQAVERGEKLGVGDVLRKGQQVLVQVEKEERGNKGAALTTFVSLAGCYLVLMPNNPGAGGISRRIDGDDRQEMKDALSQLNLPDGMGMIIRTAGVGRNVEELQWDLNVQLNLWQAIQEAYQNYPAPFLIHQESDVVMRAIRDYLRRDIGEILIDNQEIFTRAKKQIEIVRPDFINQVKLYTDSIPLFTRFQIESQIESAYQRKVRLPSGGELVIDHNEALVSIDVNSKKSVRGSDIEATALHTNLEAAEEIARQLRLRDIGGLVVIDFIDMGPLRNQREVENRLREATKMDRARIQIGRISRFGLLEMSRQRLRPSLSEANLLSCPRCHGSGVTRGIESLAASILRLVEETTLKEKIRQIQVQTPPEIATYLLNEKRDVIMRMESQHGVSIIIIPNNYYLIPNFKIDTVLNQELSDNDQVRSYQLLNETKKDILYDNTEKPTVTEDPAVKPLEHLRQVAPETLTKKKPTSSVGLVKRFLNFLFKKKESEIVPKAKTAVREKNIKTHSQSRKNNNSNSSRARRGNQGMSVKDVAKQQQAQQGQAERNESVNVSQNKVSSSTRNIRVDRPAEKSTNNVRRERKPASISAPQEEVLVVKIANTISETVKTPPVSNVAETIPEISAVDKEIAHIKLPIAIQISEKISPAELKEAKPVCGEDIFAKAQQMLANQSTEAVFSTSVSNVLAEKTITSFSEETAAPFLDAASIENNIDKTANMTNTHSSDSNVLKAPEEKFKPRRGGHQRMHGKGRRAYRRNSNRNSSERSPSDENVAFSPNLQTNYKIEKED